MTATLSPIKGDDSAGDGDDCELRLQWRRGQTRSEGQEVKVKRPPPHPFKQEQIVLYLWWSRRRLSGFSRIILVFVCASGVLIEKSPVAFSIKKNTISHLLQSQDCLLLTTQAQSCFVRDAFVFTNSLQTLIELSRITGIIWAKSVIEEDFPSNYRKMAVLIKALITEGDSIFGHFRSRLFTTKSPMVSPARNQKYKLEQFFLTCSKKPPYQLDFSRRQSPFVSDCFGEW